MCAHHLVAVLDVSERKRILEARAATGHDHQAKAGGLGRIITRSFRRDAADSVTVSIEEHHLAGNVYR
ncbi:MAG: hypothetical protein R2878_05710 [Thermoleophilia bacterium]